MKTTKLIYNSIPNERNLQLEQSTRYIFKKAIERDNIKNTNKSYIFYYDESNNFRKFHLTEKGTNASDEHFSLCGILKKIDSKSDPTNLKRNLHLQKNQEEIKSKHIFKGSFTDILKSKNLVNLLKNILDSDYYIHISITNPIYYSLVDIVDSTFEEFHHLNKYDLELKDLTYRALKNKKDLWAELFKLGYPNIKEKDLNVFSNLITPELIKTKDKCKNYHVKSIYEDFINSIIKSNRLPLIQNNEKNVLIKNLYDAYSQKTHIYDNSDHIFDDEKEIEPIFLQFEKYGDQYQGKNYIFLNSRDILELQISDVISGIFGKYYTFINRNNSIKLKEIKQNLTRNQKECLDLIMKLINKSDNESKGLIFRFMSLGEQLKSDFFLHNSEEKLNAYLSNR